MRARPRPSTPGRGDGRARGTERSWALEWWTSRNDEVAVPSAGGGGDHPAARRHRTARHQPHAVAADADATNWLAPRPDHRFDRRIDVDGGCLTRTAPPTWQAERPVRRGGLSRICAECQVPTGTDDEKLSGRRRALAGGAVERAGDLKRR